MTNDASPDRELVRPLAEFRSTASLEGIDREAVALTSFADQQCRAVDDGVRGHREVEPRKAVIGPPGRIVPCGAARAGIAADDTERRGLGDILRDAAAGGADPDEDRERGIARTVKILGEGRLSARARIRIDELDDECALLHGR